MKVVLKAALPGGSYEPEVSPRGGSLQLSVHEVTGFSATFSSRIGEFMLGLGSPAVRLAGGTYLHILSRESTVAMSERTQLIGKIPSHFPEYGTFGARFWWDA